MYYNKDSQQKDRERDILILIGMQGTIIAYLLVHLCRRMMEKKNGQEVKVGCPGCIPRISSDLLKIIFKQFRRELSKQTKNMGQC